MQRKPSPGSPRPLPQVERSSRDNQAEIRLAEGRGELVRATRGAYLRPTADAEPWRHAEELALARCVGIAARSRGRAVFSHETAALLHGCWLWRLPEQTHLTVGVTVGSSRTTGIVRHCAPVDAAEVVELGDMRVTSLDRTVVDCASTMHPRDALVVADSALRMLVGPDRRDRAGSDRRAAEVRTRWLSLLDVRRGRRGVVRARAVIARAEPWPESPGESVLRWLALSVGLPAPELQLLVQTSIGAFYTDMGWLVDRRLPSGKRERRVALHAEFDGAVKYGGAEGRDALVREKRREDAIREVSAPVSRFDAADLKRPRECARRLLDRLPAVFRRSLKPVPELWPLRGARLE
ncbi:hypothetical protein [Georgenia subflava]|uniref:Transcriptional regulator, AbiEi antitoxin, Type IV TA system n=1 Tax=Georgenia subflava TaxID=1622177 RepID=A0A6N7ENB3_9MICO|nr:hypothetical protein [Georgenia subflava]MPV38941.1 hypothetical protein [Georgenia subflava]